MYWPVRRIFPRGVGASLLHNDSNDFARGAYHPFGSGRRKATGDSTSRFGIQGAKMCFLPNGIISISRNNHKYSNMVAENLTLINSSKIYPKYSSIPYSIVHLLPNSIVYGAIRTHAYSSSGTHLTRGEKGVTVETWEASSVDSKLVRS